MWWAELLDGERLTMSTYDTGKMPCLVVSGIFPSYQFWSTCLITITRSPYTHAKHPKYTRFLTVVMDKTPQYYLLHFLDPWCRFFLCDHSIFKIIKFVQWLKYFVEKWDSLSENWCVWLLAHSHQCLQDRSAGGLVACTAVCHYLF